MMTLNKRAVLGLLVLIGVCGTALEWYYINKMTRINDAISSGSLIADDTYLHLQKFMAAYDQGNNKDYKHAVQTYGQLLDASPPLVMQSFVQYNIANNLFSFGLMRRVNDDGSLQDEARYAYMQAKFAYEQSLRLNPNLEPAKFNLSLLHAVMANNMKVAPKEQSTIELSNLPIGLP